MRDAKVIIPMCHVGPLWARPGEEVLSSFCDSQVEAGAGAEPSRTRGSSCGNRKWEAESKSGLVDLICGMNSSPKRSCVK